MSGQSLLQMLGHFALMSLLSVGGALATSPEMHRFLVDAQGWLDHRQFTEAIALAQAAPGPNILFVTLLGWQIDGAIGAVVATVGILVPSSLITFAAHRFSARLAHRPLAQVIRKALSPVAIGLTAAAGWVIAGAQEQGGFSMGLTALTFVLAWRTRLNPLWLIAAGAVAGAWAASV
jgi:chromate transporter